jgi:hypothetical protein
MDAHWMSMTPQDRIALGPIALVPLLMAIAICLIRTEVRRSAPRIPIDPPRSSAPPLRLKTTAAQREQWRTGKQRHPRATVDLTDDIETLLWPVNAGGQRPDKAIATADGPN